MILINNLYLKYVRQYFALYDVNLNVKNGESVAFVGERDSGKTSLMRILAKLEKPTKGEVYVKDIPIAKVDYSQDVSAGFVPFVPVFFDNKTVYQNFVYILKNHKHTVAEVENEINRVLIEFNLEGIKEEKIQNLSLFQKYVVSIARLAFRDLDFVMLDSIFENLNEEEREKIAELIQKRFIDKGVTTIISTSKEDYTAGLCNRNVYFKSGSIVEDKEL